ncbi:HNH endonuclease [Photobacterium rosenbergii]|uniref:HNH endonuclease n=1 Tax=Photobacterium rosenbergii TaxID=294936 RepID=A0A2T3NHB7_9GAMM|nr:HNH endonuclease [Photobacterium rosenbergii]PSW14391.1 HNH endonuclease [Photobacterium rosenbergii]
MADFEIGKIYHRKSEIHGPYKGQAQGGISTPSDFDVIFIFTGDGGEQHGYADHFTEEGIFHYTGEGQVGDMEMVRGNKAIRDSGKTGRIIHVFEYVKKAYVRYNGKAECIGYHEEQKPDREGNMRNAFVFHLMMNSSDEAVIEPTSLTSEVESDKATKEVKKKLRKLKSLEDLREAALQTSPKTSTESERKVVNYYRSEALKAYVLARSGGKCEGCGDDAPFKSKKGPYLEPHHVHRLADGGPDHPKNVIAVCPNCHRRAHYSIDAVEYNNSLIEKLSHIEK